MYQQAAQRSADALSLPPKWLGLYSDFIIKNASAVSQIESALRSLTYIIPGRFRESELASESRQLTAFTLPQKHTLTLNIFYSA
jgi:peroxin-16